MTDNPVDGLVRALEALSAGAHTIGAHDTWLPLAALVAILGVTVASILLRRGERP